MRLGFAVKVLGGGGLPSHDTRRWQSDPHLRVSIGYLDAIFDYLGDAGIDMYRMTASLAPYATHPNLPQFRGQIEHCAEELEGLGRRAREQGLRLSTHPGQYVVLNSEDERVRDLAVAELELQAELFDAMDLGPEAVVVLHVGGAAGGLQAGMDRFVAGFERVSERARSRLVIENDDRTYGLGHVHELHERTGVRVVWDILHHHCNDPDGVPDREALERALATWPDGVRPKIHYSSPKTATEEREKRVGRRIERTLALPQLRAHADLIDPIGFEHFLRETAAGLDSDVLLEAKAKDLALLRLREQLAARGIDLGAVAQSSRSYLGGRRRRRGARTARVRAPLSEPCLVSEQTDGGAKGGVRAAGPW
jgi:UV DNA damage endonuclease